ncbi:hypothetical protein LTR37_018961 [Vermiconidia calcicola]|uniref:Uncharacterized protein n=1 Tax=Vermiconidia calcicola TaxID=1690605 RepID=A0ACC3MFF4_9PEZI|nr:hypothetical protein LTR37_018961 [Vermiconidia calcicola]
MRPSQRLGILGNRIPQSSYYDQHNRPAAALYRARQPYLVRNAVTGVCIVGFVAAVRGIDTWTIKAIGQDDFSDIAVPDAPAQPPHTPNASAGVRSAGSAQ